MKLSAYRKGFVAMIFLTGVSYNSAIASLTVQRPNITKVYVRNECREVLDLTLQYRPVGETKFRISTYVFSPGENGYLVDTDNLYIYLTAKSRDSAKEWRRSQVNIGERPGKYTHRLTCS